MTGSPWGRAVLVREAEELDAALSLSFGTHDVILAVTLRVASIVRGHELDESHARMSLAAVVRRRDPSRLGEFERAWHGAMKMAEPRYPATDRKSVIFLDQSERIEFVRDWWDDVCDDPDVVAGGARGATALAVCFFFGSLAMQINSTEISESYRQIGERLCIWPTTVYRPRVLWQRHVNVVELGHRRRTRLGWEDEATRYRLREPSSRGGRNVYDPKAHVGVSTGRTQIDPPGIRLDLGDSLTMPWVERWRRRAGGRVEWRLFVELGHGDLPLKALARRTGITRPAIRSALARMVTAGEVSQNTDGTYLRHEDLSLYDDPSYYDNVRTCPCEPLERRWAYNTPLTVFDSDDADEPPRRLLPCGAVPGPLHPELMWLPGRNVRVFKAEYEFSIRRQVLGFQRECPRCGAKPGQRCRMPNGTERSYSPLGVAHHHDRIAEMPRSDWTTWVPRYRTAAAR